MFPLFLWFFFIISHADRMKRILEKIKCKYYGKFKIPYFLTYNTWIPQPHITYLKLQFILYVREKVTAGFAAYQVKLLIVVCLSNSYGLTGERGWATTAFCYCIEPSFCQFVVPICKETLVHHKDSRVHFKGSGLWLTFLTSTFWLCFI